jgi:lysozyme
VPDPASPDLIFQRSENIYSYLYHYNPTKLIKPSRATFNRRQRLLIGLILLFLAIFLWLSPWLQYQFISLVDYPVHYKEYREFGIRIPGGYDIHGIDVSRWQQKVDWERVKKMDVGGIKVRFAFMKATEGTWQEDPQFESNWQNTRKHGIIRGAYHYFHPNASPRKQALNFIRTVTLKSGDLPPVVDVEETNGMTREQVQRYTKQFLDILEKHYKVRPILYTGRDFYRVHFADEPAFKPYILWIANYRVTELTMPDDARWHFWQHSDEGHVNGINEKVDFNVFSGDSLAMRRLLVQ